MVEASGYHLVEVEKLKDMFIHVKREFITGQRDFGGGIARIGEGTNYKKLSAKNDQ